MRRSISRLTEFAAAAALGFSQFPARATPSAPLEQKAVRPPIADVDLIQALRSSASSDRLLAEFYRDRGYNFLWFGEGRLTPSGHGLLARLTSADLDGLKPEDYGGAEIAELIDKGQSGSASDLARAEIMLSQALLRYVQDLHRPSQVGMNYVDSALMLKAPSPRSVLVAAGAGQTPDQVTMMHPLYNQLRAGFSAWRDQWSRLPEIPIRKGPDLRPGAHGERVRALRARLGLADGAGFDEMLAGAVRRYKIANGLAATAVADAATVALLNQPARALEDRFRINLERLRLLPFDHGRLIVVDAAAQKLWLYEDGRVRDSMKVVVGKPTEPTPMLAGYIRYAALNPYWYVPPDLVRTRVAGAVVTEGLGSLPAKGYEVLSDWSDNPHTVDPATIDWKAVADGKLEVPVRQLPGPANMMGTMKFMFPNAFGVYLHDTPDKSLFGDADRRKSSGCVRLEDARRVAKWLFGTAPTAPATAREVHVPLAQPVPVFITYLTVAPEAEGIAFRDDVYQRDSNSKDRFASAH